MAPAEIEGSQQPLHKVFGNDFLFRIPLFQRPYAWTTEHAGALLDDALAFMGTPGTTVEDQPPYFLGSVVLIKGKDKPESDVVDGQQRLTTLTILLSALRETIESPKTKGDLTKRIYEDADSLTGVDARFRLTLRERDAEFFRTHIQEEGGIPGVRALDQSQLEDAQARIRENTVYLVDRLSKLPEPTREHLAKFLLKRCYLIVVSTSDLNSAFRIFAVLNDRGLDLSHTDILKAEVIGKIAKSKQPAYAKRWEEIEAESGRNGFDELFAHIRTIIKKAKPRGTILEEFREAVKPAESPEAFIDKLLAPYAEAFEVVRSAQYESDHGADEINQHLRWLSRIDNVDWVPPAIRSFAELKNDSKRLLSFVSGLERVAAMMMIRRANVNDRIERYGRITAEVEAGRDPFAATSPVMKADKIEGQEVSRILDGDLYLVPKIRAYVLTRLDRAVSDVGATYDYDVLSIEHVLPQSPKAGSQWFKWFPDEKERLGWVHRLGNLALLSGRKNAEAQNYEFQMKKDKYFKSKKTKVSTFALTTEVLSETEWTPAVLKKRQERLLGVLHKAWRL